MAGTPRLSLSFLTVGQAQKEFSINESLQTLDTMVAGAIEEPPLVTPPPSPVLGACYIVGPGATDAWAGKSDHVAAWTSGGWRFIPPVPGMNLYDRSSGTWASFDGSGWELGISRAAAFMIDDQQVVGPRAAAIGSPVGGATVDAEGRAAIDSILAALRGHGLIDT